MNPLRNVDPLGLRSRVCCSGAPFRFPVSLTGARHCYIETVTDRGRTTCSLYQLDRPSSTAEIFRDEDLNSGGECGEWNNSCEADECVPRIARSYANPSEYHVFGPNSNSFAGTISRECSLKPPGVVGFRTPGWGDYGAPPKAGLGQKPSPCRQP
jgi:hypothetical protein